MLHYHKFRQDLLAPQPGREIYQKPGRGRGWPQECPAIRAACGFGFDLLANFSATFVQSRAGWQAKPDIVIESDFGYSSRKGAEGAPLTQQYAWPWKKGQKLPHVISDNVYAKIRHQMKISSFLFLKTDPNELLLMTDVPNIVRPFRAMTALVDMDWFPASYPWHTILELDPKQKRIAIKKGEPLCRVIPVRREIYAAQAMSESEFSDFFDAGQRWLAEHGGAEHEGGTVDITRTYSRQMVKSKFLVRD